MVKGFAQLLAVLSALSLGSLAFALALRFQARLQPVSDKLSQWLAPTRPLPPSENRKLPRGLQGLQQLLTRAHVPIHPLVFLLICLWAGLLGARVVSVLANPLLTGSAFLTFACLPFAILRNRLAAMRLKVMKALGPALVQLAKLADVRRHPFLSLQDAVPVMDEPLRSQFRQALQDYDAGASLSNSLRDVAERLGQNPYLIQLAELVDLSLYAGADFSEALFRLLTRYRQSEELQAEERTHMKGYTWLTWVFYAGSLLPLVYWLAHDPTSVAAYQTPVAKALVLWVYISGLIIVILPSLFSVEEV